MATPTHTPDGPATIGTSPAQHSNTPKKALSKAAKNAAAGSHPNKSPARKGANGVLLKKFEAVMCDMFAITSPAPAAPSSKNNGISQEALHHLTPRYSKLPPFMDGAEQRELIENAKMYWDNNTELVCPSSSDTATPETTIVGNSHCSSPWPFDSHTALPQCGCVRGNNASSQNKTRKTKTGKDTGGVGDVPNNERAWRKEMQLANMIQCVLALLPDDVRNPSTESGTDKRPFRIIDFAGGTGHLAVPLALLLPHCEVVCLDLKKWSLDLMHQRVDGPLADNNSAHGDSYKRPCQSNIIQTSKTLPNLSTYQGSIQTYPHAFDIGVSLHACGEASDWVLRKCLQQKASWVVCSCCCGKLQRKALNPYVFQSTGGNEKEIHYPQSKAFASLGRHGTLSEVVGDTMSDVSMTGNECCNDPEQRMTAEMFDQLARAADYSELGDVRKHRNACRRAAKSLVEMDRLLFAKECMMCANDDDAKTGSIDDELNTVMARMIPWEASTKNDILIGWFQESCNPYRQHHTASTTGQLALKAAPQGDETCDVDFQVALHHLFGNNTSERNHGNASKEPKRADDDQNDWTAQEEMEIRYQIEQFLLGLKSVNDDSIDSNERKMLKFPTGIGPRKRKIVHSIAESMGLRHWGEGKKDSEKIVAVALRQK